MFYSKLNIFLDEKTEFIIQKEGKSGILTKNLEMLYHPCALGKKVMASQLEIFEVTLMSVLNKSN